MADTTGMRSFLHDFDNQCQLRPAAIALVHEERALSYSQLDVLSRQAAEVLSDQGLAQGDSIALMCERSIETIALMLGILRAGAVFVPIDRAYPMERIRYMLDDADVRCLVVDDGIRTIEQDIAAINTSVDSTASDSGRLKAGSAALQILTLEQVFAGSRRNQNENEPPSASDEVLATNGMAPDSANDDHWPLPLASDRAYIMYTSGSTGQPKGVPISHGALACYCRADIQVYRLQPEDRTLQFATLSFDISIEEIFPPLCIGSAVILRPASRSDAQIELSDIIARYRVSAVHLATGYWHEWVDLMQASGVSPPSCLRLMVVTGERVSTEHYQRWKSLAGSDVLWANAYGPTETTVTATVFVPDEHWQAENMPIGKALPGYSAQILDDTGQPVAAGQIGELHIGGPALAEGYLNRPEQTEKAFIVDPFSDRAGSRLYRTGDLARWLEDGNIEYAGRIDHQMKIGSYRIEPGEIENAINTFTGVSESLVCVVGEGTQRQLFAYVAVTETGLQALGLTIHLQSRLPSWMIPSQYCFLPQFPKNINGKIDRKALPDPATSGEGVRSAAYVEPSTDLQRKLCRLWSEVLGIPEVGIDDSFVSLGGDSLLAVRTIAAIQRELNFTLSTRDFFFLDTVALQAGLMEGQDVQRRVPPPVPLFLNSRSRQRYCLLQRPSPEKDIGRGILLVPPLANEQRRVQRPMRSLMQNFSRLGHTLLRFDWTGTANSSSQAEALSDLQVWHEDLHDALDRLSREVDSVDIVAFRVGALLTAGARLNESSINAIYYWDPVFSGELWLEQMHRLHRDIRHDSFRFLRPRRLPVNRQGIREFAGLRLSSNLHAELSRQQLQDHLQRSTAYPVTHLFLPDATADSVLDEYSLPEHVTVHRVDERSDWLDARSTTADMLITRGARLLGDCLVRHSPSVDAEQRKAV